MTQVTINDIRKIFSRLIANEISKEDASNWAYKLMMLAEDKSLRYFPVDKEEILWDAILYFQGIDLKVEPGIYLHNSDDIAEYLKSLK